MRFLAGTALAAAAIALGLGASAGLPHLGAQASAQTAATDKAVISKAKKWGLIGETMTGYLAAVTPRKGKMPADVTRAMFSVNKGRRAVYEHMAKKNGVALAEVEKMSGKSLVSRAAKGEMVQDLSSDWKQVN